MATPEIYIASTDNLVWDYSYDRWDWVTKVADHVEYIYGDNYNVYADAEAVDYGDIYDLGDKCDVACWWDNQSYTSGQDQVHLLLVSNKDWNAGCTCGSTNEAAAVQAVGPDLFDVPGPSSIDLFYTGYGYGSGMLNGCIHELGHCWGMDYNDGYVCYDSSDNLNKRSPMGGDYTETSNNCGESITKKDDPVDAYLHGYYDSCETANLPASISESYTKSDFPC